MTTFRSRVRAAIERRIANWQATGDDGDRPTLRADSFLHLRWRLERASLDEVLTAMTFQPAEELTPEGVQLVIPGAEKRPPATAKQMELW